jgi:hypothetical protein
LLRRTQPSPRWILAPAVVAAAVAAPVSWLFLVEVAAPRILGLPYHRCPYDLLPGAPESMVGVGLFLVGCFSVGWAAVANGWGQSAAPGVLQTTVNRLLFLAMFGYLASMVFFSVAVAVAERF